MEWGGVPSSQYWCWSLIRIYEGLFGSHGCMDGLGLCDSALTLLRCTEGTGALVRTTLCVGVRQSLCLCMLLWAYWAVCGIQADCLTVHPNRTVCGIQADHWPQPPMWRSGRPATCVHPQPCHTWISGYLPAHWNQEFKVIFLMFLISIY